MEWQIGGWSLMLKNKLYRQEDTIFRILEEKKKEYW